MRKRLWSPDEDEKLQKYVSQHGFGNWSEVAKKTGLQRCGKSCRLRWINYLRPDLKRGKFTAEEKMIIVNLQKVFGNSWSKIAAHLPGRTDSDIKNFWHSHFRKKRPHQLLPAHAAFLNSPSPASFSINSGPVAGLLTMPSSSSSPPPSTSIGHQQQLNAIPFPTMPLSSHISIDHDQAAVATLNLTTNVIGNHHDPHHHHHHHLFLSNLPHHDHPHLQSLPNTSMPCLEDLHDMTYTLKHAGISLHHQSKQDDEPQQHPSAMSSLHPSLPIDNTHQHDDLMSLIAYNTNWLPGNKLMVHEHGVATSMSTNRNNNNISSSGSDYSASSTSCSTSDSLQQTLYPDVGGPAPPDGLELVVWSCVNRPLQHDQLGGAHVDQVHPITDDILNYSDQEHNYTPFMDV